mmetsp:Transcript_48338/g.105352  ORF Transcript_48338/g.105352 Transcript_48338/m.105352 type:complete len:114 (+) Transcript_48338:786-1127(+)
MPIMKSRIKEFLTTTMVNVEFNHTVIHKKDLYQIHMENKSQIEEIVKNEERNKVERMDTKMSEESSTTKEKEKEEKQKQKEDLIKQKMKRQQEEEMAKQREEAILVERQKMKD